MNSHTYPLKIAHVKGETASPLLDLTIAEALEQAAQKWPNLDAIVSSHQDIVWTYKELNEKAVDLAAGLMALGLRKGDRVGIWAPNCAEWSLVQFATAKFGAILVNINPAYRLSELEFVLQNVGVRAIVTPPAFKTSKYAEMIEALAPGLLDHRASGENAKLPHLEHAILIGDTPRKGWTSLNELAATKDGRNRKAVLEAQTLLEPLDPINIQFTSGTTGMPKGATLSHKNILNNGYFVGRNIGLDAGDRLCIPVPLYHCFGMVMGNLGCLTSGAAMVYPAPTFEPAKTLETIADEKCTGLYGVPTMFIAMLAEKGFSQYNLSSLRTGCMAGSPCPVEVMKQVLSDMHMTDVTIAYGMTETSPVSFQSVPTDTLERRVSTIGRIMPHVECKVIDSDGKTTTPGVAGELCTRGYSVMLGYWGDSEKTKSVIDEDGWMHTGDLATIDAEGYGNIVGRIKDMIIRGGENIYPREIEEYFYTHPGVEDAAIFGVPDDKFGEAVCLWVRPKAETEIREADLRAFCEGKIAHYKIPKYIQIVEEFPMTVTGKVRKIEMRETMTSQLGLRETETA